MIPTAFALLATLAPPQGAAAPGEWLFGHGEKIPRFQIQLSRGKLPKPKISPKHKWEFDFSTGAYGRQAVAEEVPLDLKFRIFSQLRKETGDPAGPAARMLLRLWDYCYRRLRTDHNPAYNNGIVDVYFCFGGEAGGEQLFDEEFEAGRAKKVNTIYVYRITTFEEPLEMARELAHEYGHAILPPVGGFHQPEDWANGYLGEKLFLRYLRNEIASRRLTSDDAMGASLELLNAYAAKEIDPLWMAVAQSGPNGAALRGTGPAAMNAYLGLALFAESVLPPGAFARSLKLIGSVRAADYPAAVVAASAESPRITLAIPAPFVKKPVWIPLVKGGTVTGAKVVGRSGDWAQIVSSGATVAVSNPPQGP